jgi:hypothetical protein
MFRSDTLTLLMRFCRLYFRGGFVRKEIFAEAILDPRLDRSYLDRFVSLRAVYLLVNRLNRVSDRILVDDKSRFQETCERKGLPVPGFLGLFSHEQLGSRGEWEARLREEFPERFIAKPTLGLKGAGFYSLRREGDRFQDQEGNVYTAGDLIGEFSRYTELPTIQPEYRSEEHRVLFQRRVEVHGEIRTLVGKEVVPCVRVCTAITPGGESRILFSFFKVITGNNIVDTFADATFGNFIAEPDLETGLLGRVYGPPPGSVVSRTHLRHPETGVLFSRFKVPYWKEVLELAREAALAFRPLRTIGWDIAVTPTGPILIEGNTIWDPLVPLRIPIGELESWSSER